ncbi:Galactinol--sucrose galactosyltransferase [Thalictrum thalictroides]|uniref:galactinol--sucrose galactosyltransferase n=1 Tax=Thalictrum thalictroides TaxID=46969 RepID=A0A7J6VW98_THATH|nr:Galactinol--sucrose galactosyltransferase [Thalictrum thalictroides]
MAPSWSKTSIDDDDLPMDHIEGGRVRHPSITLEGSNFMANGHLIFSEVPSNIIATPTDHKVGCFVGFNSKESNSRHVVSIGKLKDIRFMSIFRFKVWWTTHWIGNKGSDLENETQMMMLDKSDSGSRPYVLLLPLIDGSFRASLQPGVEDDVDICVESGSTQVTSSSFRSALYIHVGDDPYNLIKDAMKVLREHLGTFKLLEEKSPPGIVDKFGWCTWDAFYLKVQPEGILEGVKVLVEGGCPPGLVLIDDGWQSICKDDEPLSAQNADNHTSAGEQMPCRLVDFKENHKFKNYKSKSKEGYGSSPTKGMGAFVKDLKDTYKSIEYVYVWHALCGYWGGLRPNVIGMPKSKVIEPKLSDGLKKTMEDMAVDQIVTNGVGLVPPEMAHQMYEGLHSHLESVGIDGVKVDVIHILEMLCEEYGGRVDLAKSYYKALTASVKSHFKGNGVIASMEHCNDFMLLGTEAISLGRVGDDFWSDETSGDPNGAFWLQGCHMVHCAYNSLWMGNFIQPDWDMFQSTHACAQFHAASRAVSGGPIYVSDNVGKHDFQLLKSLVLPDGSILRCEYYALPTRDCLFEDPLHDGKTMLKIWNLNKYTGVIGAFNCQGGGWSREARKNICVSEFSRVITSTLNPKNVEWKSGKNPISVDGVETFAIYSFQAKKLILMKATELLEISLEPFTFELFTVSPVKVLFNKGIHFAPIGLANMLNTGGAIQSLTIDNNENVVQIGLRGTGEMRVFVSEKPKVCKINGEEVSFVYDEYNYMVAIQVPWPNSTHFSLLDYYF